MTRPTEVAHGVTSVRRAEYCIPVSVYISDINAQHVVENKEWCSGVLDQTGRTKPHEALDAVS